MHAYPVSDELVGTQNPPFSQGWLEQKSCPAIDDININLADGNVFAYGKLYFKGHFYLA